MDFGTIMLFSLFFGSFGMGYFIYGKKQQKMVPLIAGVLLCIFPYFVTNGYVMVAIGVVLMALPFVLRS